MSTNPSAANALHVRLVLECLLVLMYVPMVNSTWIHYKRIAPIAHMGHDTALGFVNGVWN